MAPSKALWGCTYPACTAPAPGQTTLLLNKPPPELASVTFSLDPKELAQPQITSAPALAPSSATTWTTLASFPSIVPKISSTRLER